MQTKLSSCNFRQAPFLALMVIVLTFIPGTVLGQGAAPNDYQIGLPEHGDFSGSDFENVQLNNGNLHIEIPLWNATGRGLPVGLKYVYDSLGWGFTEVCSKRYGTCTDTASSTPKIHGLSLCCALNHLILSLVGPESWAIGRVQNIYTCSGGTQYFTWSFHLTAPDGSRHHLVPDPIIQPSGVGCGLLSVGTLYADDGSGWIMNVDPNTGMVINAISKEGVVVGATIKDTNGNQISGATDTLGRTFNSDGSYYDSSGVLRNVQVVKQNVAIQTHLCQFSSADFCYEYSATLSLPQIITLPNGMTYTFSYDQGSPTHPYYGQPLSVVLPTGGTISWSWNGEGESGPILVTRQLSGDPGPWQYALNPLGSGTGIVTDPASNDMVATLTQYAGYLPPSECTPGGSYINCAAYITQKQWYQGSHTSGTLIKTVQTDFDTTHAVLPIHETTTLNQQNLVSRTETDYDSFLNPWAGGTITASNPIEKREFDYGNGTWGTQIRTTDYGYLHLSNSTYLGLNILDKETSKKVFAGSSGSGTLTAQTLNTYDGVAIAGNTSANPAPNHDYTNFPASYNYRGNLTQISKGLKSGNTWAWLNTNNTYNDLGEILTSTDPLNHQTSYDYTDSWATINNPQCVTSTHSYGFPTTITDPLNHQTKHTYYSCTSLTGSTQDANDIAASRPGTTFSYDLMDRATAVNSPDGGQTTFSYNDAVPYTKTSTQLIRTSPTTLNKVSAVVHDGLGRVQQTQLVDPDCSSGPVKVDYTYSYDPSPPTGIPAGRFTTVSNPYCTTSDSTYGITKTRYDALDRPVRVIPPDGTDTANNVSTVYAGNVTTVTDQAGAARKSQTDGLGRMTYVYEDPATANYETDYAYDVLDDLTGVTQKGGSTSANWRTRSFQYDSLGRLIQAANPESGTINYSYDADSNLFQKVSPQANQQGTATTTTTYCYDADNRLASKTYSAQTCPVASPAVSFLYDQSSYNGLTVTNGIGRRTGMSDSSGTTAWSFDPMGRAAAEKRTLNTNVTKSFSFFYQLDGEMKQTVWPTSHQVTYTPSAAGRSVSALGTTFNFVSSATYAPQGAFASALFGTATGFNGVTAADTYNKRLQPSAITASLPSNALVQSLTYNFNLGTADNGNVYSITNGKDATRNQTFTYDKLNRITTATTQGTTGSHCWGQKFGYMSNGIFVLGPDPWGNVTQIQNTLSGCSSPTLSQGIGTNNQFTSPMVYDAAGNLTNDGAHPFTYDTENRLLTAGGVTYTYDGDGKRVKKSNGTLYWTGPGWDPLLETDLSGNATEEYVFFNGERVARVDMPANTVEYYFSDHLNSTDIVTSASGGIVRESDYVPYGGEVVISGTDPNRYKFTGKERDPESGLDDFDARFYSSPFGRFVTPDWEAKPTDVPYANFGNPQSLNLYSYVQNNPTTVGDPDGHQEQALQALEWVADTPEGQAVGNWGAQVLAGAATLLTAAAAGSGQLGTAYPMYYHGEFQNSNGSSIFLSGNQSASSSQTSQANQPGQSSQSTPAQPPEGGDEKDTARAAQREAMRQQGIPTSQQGKQTSTEAGRQYTYEVPKAGGGTETKIVQRNSGTDRSHPGQPHVEAGSTKPGGQTDSIGRPRLDSNKTKVNIKIKKQGR
jgi:RHS repeat-associated protein